MGQAIQAVGKRGAILVLVAVSMVALMGVLAMVVDIGNLQRARRMAQTAADAAALAAALELYRGHGTSAAIAAADTESKNNGFTNGTAGVIDTVNTPPLSGYYVGNVRYVEVIVRQPRSMVFGGILGVVTGIVRARGVAGIAAASNVCLVALAPSGIGLSVISTAHLTASSCDVAVNSSASNAVNVTGNSFLSASSIGIVGSMNTTPTGTVSPASPQTGASPALDPLVFLTMPSFATGCDAAHTNVNLGGSSVTALSEGVYCGGIKLGATATANLSAGTYILYGGGLNVGATAHLTGAGVTFINTDGATGASSFKPIILSAVSNTSLSAPTSGTWAGVLFYQDRVSGVGQPNTNQFTSSADATMTGTLYFPTQPVQFTSSTAITLNGGIVAYTVTANSSGTLTLTGKATDAASYALRHVAFVE